MTSDAAWRLAFALGLIFAAIASVVVYGTTVAIIVGVCAALTPVINGILAAAPGERPYLERVARSALSAGWFFRLVTIATWISFVGMGSMSFVHRSSPTREVTITGRVYAADGAPAESARVDIANGTGSAVSDVAGQFTLTGGIDRNAANVVIRAHRGGHHADQAVQLDPANPQQHVSVTLTLPKEGAPFRTVYVYLKERSVDLFLNPPRREIWDGALQNSAFTVRNDVFVALQDIARRFSAPARHSVFYITTGSRGWEANERLANDPPERAAFAGSAGANNSSGFDQHVDIEVPYRDLHQLLTSRNTWALLQRPLEQLEARPPLPETVPLFRRSCDRDDLRRFGNRSLLARFYADIAGNRVPDDFAWIDLSIDYSVCGDREAAQITLVGRLMVVEVADIENISEDTIELGPFGFHRSTATSLRHADETGIGHAERAEWFKPVGLRPGEHILIPTRLLLEFAPEHPFLHTERNFARIADADQLTPDMLGRYGVSSSDIAPLLANAPPSLDRPYVWGPAITLDSVQIDRVSYPVRRAASRDRLVVSGNEIGSCPYFYGYSPDAGWLQGGTILRGRNSPNRAGVERRPLPAFDGRVLLEEREREETHITQLEVEVTTDDGQRHVLFPVAKMPLRLSYGVRMEVSFRDMPTRRIKHVTLVASGYYVAR